jgi:hypothetical protein
MTRNEWVKTLTPDEAVFRIARGCDRCGYYLPVGEDGQYQCTRELNEHFCKAEHDEWLRGEMDV